MIIIQTSWSYTTITYKIYILFCIYIFPFSFYFPRGETTYKGVAPLYLYVLIEKDRRDLEREREREQQIPVVPKFNIINSFLALFNQIKRRSSFLASNATTTTTTNSDLFG